MTGGGKYEPECRELRHKIQAAGVILIVCHGNKGDGFEVQVPPELAHLFPGALREVADKMEADISNLTTTQPKG